MKIIKRLFYVIFFILLISAHGIYGIFLAFPEWLLTGKTQFTKFYRLDDKIKQKLNI